MLKEYKIVCNVINEQELLFDSVKQEALGLINEFTNKLLEMNEICEELNKIALRPNAYSHSEYFDTLIDLE